MTSPSPPRPPSATADPPADNACPDQFNHRILKAYRVSVADSDLLVDERPPVPRVCIQICAMNQDGEDEHLDVLVTPADAKILAIAAAIARDACLARTNP